MKRGGGGGEGANVTQLRGGERIIVTGGRGQNSLNLCDVIYERPQNDNFSLAVIFAFS